MKVSWWKPILHWWLQCHSLLRADAGNPLAVDIMSSTPPTNKKGIEYRMYNHPETAGRDVAIGLSASRRRY